MFQSLLSSAIRSVETKRRCENRPSALSCLNGSGSEAAASAHALNMINYRNLGITSQDKVAVHTVHEKVVRNSSLRRRETLRNHGAAVDAARTRGMP